MENQPSTRLGLDGESGNNAGYRSTDKPPNGRSGHNNSRKSSRKFFIENHTVKGLEVKIQFEKDPKLLQQKCKLIPMPVQKSIGKKLISS